jgi:hypothetical protein
MENTLLLIEWEDTLAPELVWEFWKREKLVSFGLESRNVQSVA